MLFCMYGISINRMVINIIYINPKIRYKRYKINMGLYLTEYKCFL